jgi:hypothetical protein
MPKIIAIDRRLVSHSYRGSVGTARQYLADHVFACDATTPLSDFVAFVRRYATAGTRNWLEIWCHGLEYEGQLGYGLLFCREMLSHSAACGGTVGQLSPLHGRVWHTVLRVCGPAHISSRPGAISSDGVCSIDDFGDGHAFCSTLARTLGSSLEASTELQAFFTNWRSSWFASDTFIPGSLDFGLRDGLWVEYDQAGNLLPSRSVRHLSTYRTSTGETRRPDGQY